MEGASSEDGQTRRGPRSQDKAQGFEGTVDEDAEGGGDAENPVDVLPDSRILVTSISAFGTKSEAFIHVPFGKEEAEVLLENMKNISPDTVGEKIREALNAL